MRRGPVGQQGNQPPSNPLHRLHRLHRLHQLLQVPPRRSAHPRATVKTSRTATSGGLGLPLTIFYYQQGPRYILHILRRLATLSTIVSIIFFFGCLLSLFTSLGHFYSSVFLGFNGVFAVLSTSLWPTIAGRSSYVNTLTVMAVIHCVKLPFRTLST